MINMPLQLLIKLYLFLFSVKVTNLKNNKSIVLRINDRGPFVNDRIIDLSSKAADILDLKEITGLVRVQI